MIRAVDKQLTIFGEESRKRVRDRLRGWYDLTRKIDRLKRLIAKDKETLKYLDDQIEASLVPNYEMMDMPRVSGTSDKVGNLAVKLADKREELRLSILHNEFELNDLERQLREIETAVTELSPRHAEIVKRYYLYNENWGTICIRMHIQKSRLYEMLAEVLDVLGDQL
ncbi:hypothetical protein GCM10011571_17430 [Marinithermofilum abyssi]|uniref:DUF1492 domain-containing protein n=1 Tax=Marinithermofilum abyssi TaxID=1571185 RepID=A0A8J2VHX0_9BACL|nr:hypothetical protein [Marinithermofilum abyssi]GGE16276.1 hypothetical protein GCM10011571_17430 [Marinithermofilum abyssi]